MTFRKTMTAAEIQPHITLIVELAMPAMTGWSMRTDPPWPISFRVTPCSQDERPGVLYHRADAEIDHFRRHRLGQKLGHARIPRRADMLGFRIGRQFHFDSAMWHVKLTPT